MIVLLDLHRIFSTGQHAIKQFSVAPIAVWVIDLSEVDHFQGWQFHEYLLSKSVQ